MRLSTSTRFDVIIPTYNRPDLLKRCLESLRCALVPDGIEMRFIVVDNNSHPPQATRNAEVVHALSDARFSLVMERQQGLSHARNAGIAASDAQWVGFVDDDEQVAPSWIEVASRFLSRDEVDFIGGPYLPNWEHEPPSWLPARVGQYIAVVGWIDLADQVREFNRELDDSVIAMGGNMVVKRAWLTAVGSFATDLGRSGSRLLSGEDQDMHARLIGAGARGWYVPELIIYHFVPAARMTRRYHRRWAFWHSYSLQHLQYGQPRTVPFLLGVPRYLVGNALRALPSLIGATLLRRKHSPWQFKTELDFIGVLGRFYAQLGPALTGSRPVARIASISQSGRQPACTNSRAGQ